MSKQSAIVRLVLLFSFFFNTSLHAEPGKVDKFITFSGFGTIGAVHNQGQGSAFVRDITEPNGAKNKGLSWEIDSRVGLQANVNATENLEGVAQIISRYNADNNFQPEFTWGFLKFSPNDTVNARVGRVGFDALLAADSRDVGYSYLWVRPPVEYYGQLPLSSIDGVDAVIHTPIGRGVGKIKLYSGIARQSIPNHLNQTVWQGISGASAGAMLELSGSRVVGGYIDYQDNHWTARLGKADIKVSNEVPSTLFDGLGLIRGTAAAHPIPSIASSLNSLANDLSMLNKDIAFSSAGLAYENGPLQTQMAYSHFTSESLLFPESFSGYFSVGYRIGKFTPYGVISSVRNKKSGRANELAGKGVDAIVGVANFMLSTGQSEQDTFSLGMRYDFMNNAALKFQIDRIHNRNCSPVSLPMAGSTSAPCSPSLLWQSVPVFWDGHANIYSAVLDFTF